MLDAASPYFPEYDHFCEDCVSHNPNTLKSPLLTGGRDKCITEKKSGGMKNKIEIFETFNNKKCQQHVEGV